MATTESMQTATFIANGDMSALQYHIVMFNGTGVNWEIEMADHATTADPIGVLQNDPNADGQPATVAIGGICKVELGGTVEAGDFVTSNTTGEAIATTTAGDDVIGQILEGGADGDIRPLLIDKRTLHA